MLEVIVCVDKDWGFSKNGTIPWHFPEDLKLFNNLTKRVDSSDKKNICIMGRLTWDGIPMKYKPLKDRINIVVSSSIQENKDDLFFVKSIEDGIKLCLDLYLNKKVEHVFVCGGKSLYDYALNSVLLSNVHVTKINKRYDCDIFFDKESLFKKCYNDMSTQYDFSDGKEDLNYSVFKPFRKFEGEDQYTALLYDILTTGHRRQTRNSVTYSKFSGSMKFDLEKGFPLLTTKKVLARWVWEELMFFLSGKTDTNILTNKGITIWQPNTTREFLDSHGLADYEIGDMGSIYGFVLRHASAKYEGMRSDYTGKGYDQVAYILETLKKDPFSRRLIMTTFDPAQAQYGVLYPCHGICINFGVDDEFRLNCVMHQRSADEVCGIPFNIASYAMMIHVFVELVNNDEDYKGEKLKVGTLTINMGDMHIYDQPDHIEAVKEHLVRVPYKFPEFKFKEKINKLENMTWEKVALIDYISHPALKVKMVA